MDLRKFQLWRKKFATSKETQVSDRKARARDAGRKAQEPRHHRRRGEAQVSAAESCPILKPDLG